jgi:hypothetical protein
MAQDDTNDMDKQPDTGFEDSTMPDDTRDIQTGFEDDAGAQDNL